MSKARSIIMSVIVEGRSQADTARLYEVSPSWVSKLVVRYHVEGDAAVASTSHIPDSMGPSHGCVDHRAASPTRQATIRQASARTTPVASNQSVQPGIPETGGR